MELKQYQGALEAILFAHGEPIGTDRLAQALELEPEVVERLLLNLEKQLEKADRGLVLLRLEDRWQLATKNEYSTYVKRVLDNRRNAPLSQAALEVLSVIAYNQPVSRSFIDQVRGVDSSSVVAGLLEKGLVQEAGRLDLPGHPVSFATTDVFLRCFGLNSLNDLPSLHGEDGPDAASDTED